MDPALKALGGPWVVPVPYELHRVNCARMPAFEDRPKYNKTASLVLFLVLRASLLSPWNLETMPSPYRQVSPMGTQPMKAALGLPLTMPSTAWDSLPKTLPQ